MQDSVGGLYGPGFEPQASTMGAAYSRDLEPRRVEGRSTQDTTPCSVCGDTKGKKAGPTGKDLEDRVLRQRRCANGHVYVTMEIALPPEVYFSDVDYFYKKMQREANARRRGSDTTRWWKHIKPMTVVVRLAFKRDGLNVFQEWNDKRGRNVAREFRG